MSTSQAETMAGEETSRIFVKNLPPNITEADFRKHFSARGREVTDVKLIPLRRIGFIGYKSHEDAARAVKYFNRSFIRMSRVAVDFAKPVIPATSRISTVEAKEGTDATQKKRKRDAVNEADPKLQEFLEVMGHPLKKPRDQQDTNGSVQPAPPPVVPVVLAAEGSDDEYEDIPSRPSKRTHTEAESHEKAVATPQASLSLPALQHLDVAMGEVPQVIGDATDNDWLRSRTNRVLDLVDLDDPAFPIRPAAAVATAVPASGPPVASIAVEQAPNDEHEPTSRRDGDSDSPAVLIQDTARLFLRNLSYKVTEDDIRDHFGAFGTLEEINLPLDNKAQSKGFAMVQFEQSESAMAAFQTDGTIFQGRIIHILPAAAKRESRLDEFAISKLPLKKQHLLKKKAEAASTTFNWNSLFMSQDAVNTAIAERLGVTKHELLNPTDASAAVRQAVAETTVIQEAKAYFAANGVNIEAFKSQQRGDTSILVKNIRNTSIEELRQLFEEHGTVLRVLMPPSGTTAIVQFAQPAHCRAAFTRKAYSRFKESVLFLEKGPKALFADSVAPPEDHPAGVQKATVADLLERDDGGDQLEIGSLFVRNLNFSTTTDGLTDAFKPLEGFVSAKVKTKTDPKKPGQVLSMGFGFCAFKTKEHAQAALQIMDSTVLDGHRLIVKASHRGLDAAEEQRQKDLAKKNAGQRTKLVIKNLPFEVSKKDVRTLFGTCGRLVAIRIPQKLNHTSRGFAFAEFSTAKEALNALNSLKDTHLLGRRLVIDFAEADEVDPEEQIKAMEKKMQGQVNKVALQELTGRGRTKLNIGNDEDEDEGSVPFPCVLVCTLPPGPTRRASPTRLIDAFCHREECYGVAAGIYPNNQISKLILASPGPYVLKAQWLPILPSQCYSSTSEYETENGYGHPTSRPPLGESTGNARHSQCGTLIRTSYVQRLDPLSSMATSMPTPLLVPTQALGSTYDSPVLSRQQDRHQLENRLSRRRRDDANPLWTYWQQFETYRKKQDEKDNGEGQKKPWPQVLEWGFLDVPHIGRKKWSVRGKESPFGRNMLLCEYLWYYYLKSLPPNQSPDLELKRTRKQVSSHIQVVKNIFKNHRCCKEKEKGQDKGHIDSALLKRHPVMIALSEGRLPDERPNFDYFVRILALNDYIAVRPKRCWIFVSHPDVAVSEDGSGYLQASGDRLGRDKFPHLERNLEREKWAKEEQQIFKGALLHEFTKDMTQTFSSTLREATQGWETAFPDLHHRLETIVAANTHADPLAAESELDILHMHVMMDLNEKRRFPSQAELNSWVEINIEKPHLLNHRWKVETRLARPPELSYSNEDSGPELLYETSAEIAIQYQHRPGCDGSHRRGGDRCHCTSQHCRRDWVTVPFPADVWALTLSNCAEYPAHPQAAPRGRSRKAKMPVKREDDSDADPRPNTNNQPTQMDLMPKIAMVQEIWSRPSEASQERDVDSTEAQNNARWARRALMIWTFETAHSIDKEGKVRTAQGGKTTWRFLTILDPLSEYHLQNSVLGGLSGNRRGPRAYSDSATSARQAIPRGSASSTAIHDSIMSPNPTYHHLSASMSENFATGWETPDGLHLSASVAQAAYDAHLMAHSVPGSGITTPAGYGLPDGYGGHGGLATPPPTASLNSSFAHSFGGNSNNADHLTSYMATTVGMDHGSQALATTSLSHVADPYLTANPPGFDVASYNEAQNQMATWGGGSVTDIESGSWPNGQNTAWTASVAPPIIPSGGHEVHNSDSQGWVHVEDSSGVVVGSDLSRDWEEVTSNASTSVSEASTDPSHRAGYQQSVEDAAQTGDGYPDGAGHGREERGSISPSPPPQTSYPHGVKRSRSDSLDAASCLDYRALSMPKLTRR
ncbi:hypothetical protein B0H67DRAFT_597319 [Lasiosphaeris hirsuta]|uniref:Multiple RNA-binding domain-containing protein 1 n=1 Tax=Lasiosphaeris hirsuta TaxID=260670 RepID=A0AA40EDL3_9PEZI|nr:hypothetical protein B0H67DRAFT_597319 [Lasiosphaeris hirsuta]